MKTDLGKLIMFIWMAAMMYLMYRMYIDLNYMTDLVHAYISMAVEHIRH